jgi:segregation and condensation protein A
MLLEHLRNQGKLFFDSLFTEVKSRLEVIVTFLAMLELVKVRAIRVFQDEPGGQIIIEPSAGMDEAAQQVVFDEVEENHDGA